MLTEVKGDLLETPCKYIAHGVNCQGVMGSGVARALYEKWPIVRESYYEWFKHSTPPPTEHGPFSKPSNYLGITDYVDCGDKTVINCFIQEHYIPRGPCHLDYTALRHCFDSIVASKIKEVAIPKIGCGLAGGDWENVKDIINEITGDKTKVIVYLLGEVMDEDKLKFLEKDVEYWERQMEILPTDLTKESLYLANKRLKDYKDSD